MDRERVCERKTKRGSDRESMREREKERQGERYRTEDLTNGPQKQGEMSHLFVVGVKIGHHEKAVRVKRESQRMGFSHVNAEEKCWAKERTQVEKEQAPFYGKKSDVAANPARIL